MTIRTSQTTVRFRNPFILGGLDEELPAGSYLVETDEALLEGISFLAYRRISTRLHVPSNVGYRLMGIWTIDPKELEAALERDRTCPESPTEDETHQNAWKRSPELYLEDADRQAIERGEDDGMIVTP